MSHCIIITGNPVDGFTHYGPFDDCEQANDWAEGRFDEWRGAELHPPRDSGRRVRCQPQLEEKET